MPHTVSGRRGAAAPKAAARKTTSRKSKGPGRPEGTSRIRDDILDAAERLFANLGYAGTTLREVSAQAKVTQALINYYFGSKFGLFGETFLRRAVKISEERLARLAEIKARGQGHDLNEIVKGFLLPILHLRDTDQGRAFLRLQARLHTEPPNLSYELRKAGYDISTRAYIEAFKEALPHLSDIDVHWRVTMMVGTYLYVFSDTHRMEDMVAKGAYDPEDTDALIQQVIRFIVGGMR